ncbi:MAG TPA: acyltransferase [Thermoleophilaceae bacterium]|nr:acyltransferase [Thermoleophilaceae bacterium]
MSLAGDRFAFRSCGEDVTIYEWVRILDPELIDVGSHVIIDDFVFIDGSGGISIGSHVHVASFASLVGGGRIVVGDFAGIAGGSRLVSGSDRFDGSGLTGPTIPDRWRSVERSRIEVGRHAVLGTNVVVHPGVTIGDGTIVGSNSLVTRDLPPWTICVGTPAEPVGERPRERVLEYERALLEHESSS